MLFSPWIKPLVRGSLEESFDFLVGEDEFVLAEQTDEFFVEGQELIAEEPDVQNLEFLEDFGAEDIVHRFEFGASASDVARHEQGELLHDAVAKREFEVVDDETVEFLEFGEGRLA